MIAEEVSSLAIGVVSELHPTILGRVKVRFPHLRQCESDWCPVVSPMGGPERGFVMSPEVGDHVLVGFEHGCTQRGFILGSIWNEEQKVPPADGKPKENNLRFIRSRAGHVIRLDDTKGKEKIEIIDGSGKHSIVMDMAKKRIVVTSDGGDISVNAKSGKVSVEATTISLKASGAINIEASQALTLKGQVVNIN